MDAHEHAVGALLSQVRERLWQVGRRRTWTVGFMAAGVALGIGGLVTWWVARDGLALVLAVLPSLRKSRDDAFKES